MSFKKTWIIPPIALIVDLAAAACGAADTPRPNRLAIKALTSLVASSSRGTAEIRVPEKIATYTSQSQSLLTDFRGNPELVRLFVVGERLRYGHPSSLIFWRAAAEEEDEGGESGEVGNEETPTSGSTVKLKRWDQRRRRDLGTNSRARTAPLVDQSHHIMQLWRAGDVHRVDAYIKDQGLRRSPVFPRPLQALIELAGKDNQPDERAQLESVMNHVTARGAHSQMRMQLGEQPG